MSYSYEAEKARLFTDEGQRMFLAIRDQADRLLRASGAVRLDRLLIGTGSTWTMLACVDRLVELLELREVPQDDVVTQDKIYVRSNA